MTFEHIAELLARISLAFVRTFDLVMKGAFGDVALSDAFIIVATGIAGLIAGGALVLIVRR